jgi:hypothetical protein
LKEKKITHVINVIAHHLHPDAASKPEELTQSPPSKAVKDNYSFSKREEKDGLCYLNLSMRD